MCCNLVPDHEETASTTSGVKIKWTQDRKDQLLALRKEGKSPKEAAEVMGRSKFAVFNAWQRFFSKDLGSWGSHVWTQDRKDQLQALWIEGKSQKEAAEVMGYSEVAVRLAWSCFFSKDVGPWASRVWTQERKDQLLALCNVGKSPKEAAEVMGRSKVAVRQAWIKFFGKDHGPWDGGIKSDVLIDNELLETLLDLRNEGRCQAEAADMLGISVGRLNNAWAYHFKKGHGSWDGRPST